MWLAYTACCNDIATGNRPQCSPRHGEFACEQCELGTGNWKLEPAGAQWQCQNERLRQRTWCRQVAIKQWNAVELTSNVHKMHSSQKSVKLRPTWATVRARQRAAVRESERERSETWYRLALQLHNLFTCNGQQNGSVAYSARCCCLLQATKSAQQVNYVADRRQKRERERGSEETRWREKEQHTQRT